MSLDSSVIDLCLKMFDWAHYCRTKGAVKLHLLLDHDGYLPSFAVITDGKTSDIEIARQLSFDPGTIIVDDRGYTDYALWGRWTSQKIYFVTRMNENAVYKIIKKNKVPQTRNIVKDEVIELTGRYAFEKCPYRLRRIEFYNEPKDEILVFITNNMALGASTVAEIYRDR